MIDRRTKQPRSAGADDPSAADLGSGHAVAGAGEAPLQGAALVSASAAASVLDAENPSSAAIRSRLAELAAQREETLEAITKAEAFEAENLLKVDDAALEANDDRIIRLRRQAARLDKLEAIALDKLAVAEAREAEAGRVERYQAAEVLVAEADRWIREVYPAHAAEIAAGLARLVEIKAAVDKVNDDRPENAPRLDADAACRAPPESMEPQYADQEYLVDATGHVVHPLPGDVVKEVSGKLIMGEHQFIQVFKRVRRVRIPTVSTGWAYQVQSLDRSVMLPSGAHGTEDHWPRR